MYKILIQRCFLVLSSIIVSTSAVTYAGTFGFGNTDSVSSTVQVQVGWAANGDNTFRDEQFLSLVRWAVNWVLWLLALIALILLIYWGILMVTAAGDEEKYKKWFSILRAAAIWLTLIWVAWMIASLIFWITVVTWESAVWTTAWTEQ